MPDSVYGPSYKLARLQRLEFAENKCEVCQSKEGLECHHRGDLAYARDRANRMTMRDCVILCRYHHDAITDSDRRKRNENRSPFKESESNGSSEVQNPFGGPDKPGSSQQQDCEPDGSVD